MTKEYSSSQMKNIESVRKLFVPLRSFDEASVSEKLALFANDAVWWNGLPRLHPLGEDSEHKGLEKIRKLIVGSGTDARHLGIDAYELSTVRYEDLLELADGDYVVRQHTMYAKTRGGRDYCNAYCFIFRFNGDGKIAYMAEHWNTWWGDRFLFDQIGPSPTHITGNA